MSEQSHKSRNLEIIGASAVLLWWLPVAALIVGANWFKAKTVANIEDFTILVRCGAVQSATATTPCRSPTLLTAVFRIILVPGGGLEPPWDCSLRILSPLRLPISPSGHVESTVAT